MDIGGRWLALIVSGRLMHMADRDKPKPPGLSEERAPPPEQKKSDETAGALAHLQRSIREGIDQLERREGIPAAEVIEGLRRRHD